MDFNPRSREGSDPVALPVPAVVPISIRAPARGATKDGNIKEKVRGDFNPRSREGSDACRLLLRQGSRYFNPRSREGSDCRT